MISHSLSFSSAKITKGSTSSSDTRALTFQPLFHPSGAGTTSSESSESESADQLSDLAAGKGWPGSAGLAVEPVSGVAPGDDK